MTKRIVIRLRVLKSKFTISSNKITALSTLRIVVIVSLHGSAQKSLINFHELATKHSYYQISSEEVALIELNDKDKEELKRAFTKYDKKSVGNIKPSEIADVFRMAGQNPTVEECNLMINEADEPGT
ncbi:calmodulin-like isoform X2, partial [Brachionus plicatilis]